MGEAADVSAGQSYAILRDLDRDYEPFGVILGNDVEAQLHVFENVPHAERYKRHYKDFDSAVQAWSRSALISVIGQEGDRRV